MRPCTVSVFFFFQAEDGIRDVAVTGVQTRALPIYLAKPGSMPASYEELARSEARHVIVCDYIAGMTDPFLLRQHREHFDGCVAGDARWEPSPWTSPKAAAAAGAGGSWLQLEYSHLP